MGNYEKSEVYDKQKTNMGSSRLFLHFFLSRLTKQKPRLCKNGEMKQWRVNDWETYNPLVNWISVRSLLDIESVNEFPSGSIEFVLVFPKTDIDVDVFVELHLVMWVDVKH